MLLIPFDIIGKNWHTFIKNITNALQTMLYRHAFIDKLMLN